MKDGIKRIDILEMITPEGLELKNRLYGAIMDYACRQRLKEVRIQMSFQDPDLEWIRSLGFINRWRTNIMGRIFDPIGYFRDHVLKKLDPKGDYKFTIQTPGLGTHHVGRGRNALSLFTGDDVFNRILLGRCSAASAVEEGRIVILGGNEEAVNALKSLSSFNKWRCFHIDYI